VVESAELAARRGREVRCKHDLVLEQCGQCNRRPASKNLGPHLPAVATLRCRECHQELVTIDANKTSGVKLMLAERKMHSQQRHPDATDPLAPADVILTCKTCDRHIDTLGVVTTSLGTEMMNSRTDHELTYHR
jgi:hypothetical protein